MFILGKSFSASSPLTEGWTMTSSPVDFVSLCRIKDHHISCSTYQEPS